MFYDVAGGELRPAETSMETTLYRNRRAASLTNELLRVTVVAGGGHVAEIADLASGVNPLWSPPWPSIDPSSYDPVRHPEYGGNAESRLLAGILGHNLCADIFGGPSEEEAVAGLDVHGEASVVDYALDGHGGGLFQSAVLPQAHLKVERVVRLERGSRVVCFEESIENLTATDRPIGWTEHVTLGPPFLERGATEFRVTATKSKVFEGEFGAHSYLRAEEEFLWPAAPGKDGLTADLRVYTSRSPSSAFTTHLMDPAREHAWFVAFAPASGLCFGYVWRRADFPFLGIWEENHSRLSPPWNGAALTRGMEFGVSPMPESRRQMVDRGSLFGTQGYRWVPARTRLTVRYAAFLQPCARVPETVEWDGGGVVRLGF